MLSTISEMFTPCETCRWTDELYIKWPATATPCSAAHWNSKQKHPVLY